MEMKTGLLDGSGSGAFDGLVEEFGRCMKLQQKAIIDAQGMPAGRESHVTDSAMGIMRARAVARCLSRCLSACPAAPLVRLCACLSPLAASRTKTHRQSYG